MKLNLGCGSDYREGWVNVDLFQKADVKHDLNVFQYPFKDDTFDEIYASHVIEHLSDTVKVMEELWRISRNGARVEIRVPHYSHNTAFANPTHVKFFALSSMDIFDVNSGNWERYGKARFKVLQKELRWDRKGWGYKKIGLPFKLIAELCVSINPFFTERFSALFGGFGEIIWVMEVVKGD